MRRLWRHYDAWAVAISVTLGGNVPRTPNSILNQRYPREKFIYKEIGRKGAIIYPNGSELFPISPKALEAMQKIVRLELEKQLEQVVTDWKKDVEGERVVEGERYLKVKKDIDNLAKARFALETFIEVGFGQCNGYAYEFNAPYLLKQSLVDIYIARTVWQVRMIL